VLTENRAIRCCTAAFAGTLGNLPADLPADLPATLPARQITADRGRRAARKSADPGLTAASAMLRKDRVTFLAAEGLPGRSIARSPAQKGGGVASAT